jgi:hypothetical protein
MGLFGIGKNTNRPRGPSKWDIKLDFTTLLILVILSLVLIQAIGLLFEPFVDVNLGPAFVLIAISMSAATSIAIFKKLLNNTQITKKDIFAIIITALLSLVMLFFLRDLIPEIFEQAIVQLQSMVGF